MLKYRRLRSLQKFVSIHASIYDHFNQERHFYNRQEFEFNRSAALAEWQQFAA